MKLHFIQYIIPNLFTTFALYLGYLSLWAIIDYKITHACYLLLGSVVFDGLDGKIARLLKTNTLFGAQLDSLSDVICFGLIPPILIQTILPHLFGSYSQTTLFMFLASTALRLARFQTHDKKESESFTGLPCPAAAIQLLSLVLLKSSDTIYFEESTLIRLIGFFFMFNTILMVSTVPYPSFKKINYHSIIWVISLVLAGLLGSSYSIELGFVNICSTYVILPCLLLGIRS